MNFKIGYITVIGVIIYFIWMAAFKKENFSSDFLNHDYDERRRTGLINASPYISVAPNVILDRYNRIDSLSTKPPLPKEGEIDCIKVTCPNYIPTKTTCWRCS